MADSVRLRILKNIETTLEAVDGTGSWNVTLSKVERFLASGNTKETVPLVVIIPDFEEREEGMSQIVHSKLDVYLILYVVQEKSDTTPLDEFIDPYVQDISKALLADRGRGLSGGEPNAEDTEIMSVEPFEEEDGQHYHGLIFKLQIEFRTEPDDYTAAR